MPTDLLSESRAQSKEDSLCPKPIISSEHDLSGEPALARSTIVGRRTVYISKEGATIASIAARENPPDAQ
jgi:hypothetical protein